MRDVHRVLGDLGARVRNIVAAGREALHRGAPIIERPGYRRRTLLSRRSGLALAAILAFAAVGVGGYAIGASQAIDVGAAEQAGTAAGEKRGTAAGAREGYRSAFQPARERAYEAAYRQAYRAAYRAEFEQADLRPPSRIPVSAP